MKTAALPLLLLGLALPALAQEPSHDSVNEALADAVLLPVHERWQAEAEALAPAIEALCAEQSDAALENARAAFDHTMGAWQAVQPAAIGPITKGARRASVQFWPDKHGTATRQLNQALAEQDPALLNDLADQSVALQNLQALEVLLYAVDLLEDSDKAAYACQLAAAIGRRQGELASAVLSDWQGPDGFLEGFKSADAGNDFYFDAEEAAVELFRAMTQNLEEIVALKLERPLDDSLQDARPKRAENPWSERSLDNVQENVATVEALYATPGGYGAWLADSRPGLHERVLEVLSSTRAAADAINLPLEQAVEDPDARPKVEALLEQVKTLRVLMRGTVADAAGIVIGFNAMDGD